MTARRQRNADQRYPTATKSDQRRETVCAAQARNDEERPRATNPRSQVPNLLNLDESGQLKIDELITQEYTLDQVQQGYDDQAAGTIIRALVRFGR